MKILYVEDDDDIRDLFVLKIESISGYEVVEKQSGNEAIELLETDSDFSFIVSDFNMPNGTGLDLYKYVKDKKLQSPFIVLSTEDISVYPEFNDFFERNDANGHVEKPPMGTTLEDAIEKAMDQSKESVGKTSELISKDAEGSTFASININIFLKTKVSPSDVYLKLSDNKYVKIINKDELYSKDFINKYIGKNTKRLFIPQNEHKEFADNIMNSLLDALLNLDVDADDANDIIVQVHEAVQDQLLNIGIDQQVVEVAKKTADTTLKMMSNAPTLSAMLSKVNKGGDYIFEHSLMISYISSAIVDNIEWETKDAKMKLSLASFMHDITLENHELAKIQSLEDKKLLDFTPEERDLYKKHPLNCMNLINKMSELPTDIDHIVYQHHELPGGNGFPRGLSASNINPLAAVFIVAHQVVNYLYSLDDNNNFNPDEFITEMEKSFNKGTFKKPLKGMIKIFRPK